MITLIDKALQVMLRETLPEKVCDISFDVPSKDWVAHLSSPKPMLNLFLYDLHENRELRDNVDITKDDLKGNVTKIKPPVRVDIFYIVTVWSPAQNEAFWEEHRLLSKTLASLFKFPSIPVNYLGNEFGESLTSVEIPLTVAFPEAFKEQGVGQFWSAIEQNWKASFSLKITIPIELDKEMTLPMVTAKILKYDFPYIEETIQFGGIITNSDPEPKPIHGAKVELSDMEGDTIYTAGTDENGRFVFSKLTEGEYMIDVSVKGFKKKKLVFKDAASLRTEDLIIKLER